MPDYHKITNLIFEPKGKHDSALTYTIKDTVMNADGSKVYFALKDVPAGIELSDTEYWILQMDLSASKNAMDSAAATAKTQTDAVTKSAQDRVDSMVDTAADAITNLNDYTEQYGLRVRGETAKATGNPVSFLPDAGSLLQPVTVLEPQQEGSGDPYPMGGGKNKFPVSSLSSTGSSNIYTRDMPFALPAGQYTLSFKSANIITTYMTLALYTGETKVKDTQVLAGEMQITFTLDSAADGLVWYVREAVQLTEIQLELGSTATSYAPYSNIRPFIGYDKLDLNVTGKNIYNPSEVISKGNFEHHGVTGTWRDDGDLILNGTLTSNAWQSIGTSHMMSGKIYTVSVGGNVVVAVWDRVADVFVGNATLGTPLTFTAHSAGTYAYAIASVTGASFADERVMLMVAEGSVATGWQPYQVTLHTVQIGQTVYGGKFDWLTGKLTAEWAMLTLDGTEPWSLGESMYYRAWLALTNYVTDKTAVVCSHFKGVKSNEYATNMASISGGTVTLRNDAAFGNPSTLTADDFKAYLAAQHAAGTPVQIAYKLATPIEIQLTPTLVMALDSEETNYIYGDGDIEVEYVKPLKVSIAERVDMLLDTFAEPFEKTGDIVTCEPVAGIEFDNVATVLEPQQEGSGDPYPAGGGRNLLPNIDAAVTHYGITFTPNADGSITVSGTNTSPTAAATCIFGNIDFEGGKTYSISGVTGYEANTLQIWVQSTDAFPAGSRLQSFDGAVTRMAAASESCEVRVQVGSGVTLNNVKIYPMLAEGTDATYAPYSNIRPFVPWTELSATRSGKNLLQNTAEPRTVNGITFNVNLDGSININGTATDNTWIAVNKEFNIRAGDYIVSGCVGGSLETYFFYVVVNNSNKISASGEYAFHVSDETTASAYIVVYSGTTISETIYPMLRLASVADPTYAPYTGTLHTVQIGQTVYGIRYEWLTGKAWIEWAMVTLDGTEAFQTSNYGAHFYLYVYTAPTSSDGSVINVLSSHFKGVAESDRMGNEPLVYLMSDHNAVEFRNTGCVDVTAWKTYLAAQKAAGTPVQIAYKLATPVEIQLTPTEIIALSGVNTLYGDGVLTVTGRQDKAISLESRLAALESAILNV